jgi:serine/threonine protein kinase
MHERFIFMEALEIDDPREREAHVVRACGGDDRLRARVEALLRRHEEAASCVLDREPGFDLAATADPGPLPEKPGTSVGPYRLMEAIGEGGMGIVYVAHQHRPVRRKVALKVIKPGMDTKQVIARFEAERQALALMDHPNIAKVHDAGATDSGRPYFAMELVRGIPITEYCDREQLPVPDRLELFTLVCRAVQHAHQKGVIHRDLKPTNVLVTVIDGVAVPKVIDFGVAKATGASLTERTLYTGFHHFVGTPLYMSPEQAELSGADVDTRSVVYSLGVLLNELLTGTTPFDPETFKRAAFDEMRRIIREEEPPRPSTRLSSLGATRATVSANRRADARHLDRAVRGELDWVVMKALEKDRRRRYETANDFAADVMNYLADRPVEACPPSRWYRVRKFARRNRVALGFAAFAAAGLVLAVVGLTAGLVAISREQVKSRERLALARRAADEMYTDVAREWLADREGMTPVQRKFLERALAFYERFAAEPSADPEDRHKAAQALDRVGQIRRAFGQTVEAMASSEQAVARLSALAAEYPDRPRYRRSLAEALGDLSQAQEEAGRIDEAESSLRRAIAIGEELRRAGADRLEPDGQSQLFWHHSSLAQVLVAKGWGNASRSEADRAYELAEGRLKETPKSPEARHEMALALIQRAGFSEALGRHAEAEEQERRAIAIADSLADESPSKAEYRVTLALGWNNLGARLMNQGLVHRGAARFSEARDAFQKGEAVLARLVQAYPHVVRYRAMRAQTLNNLGFALTHAGRLDEALDVHRRCLELREALTAEHPDVPEHRFDAGASLCNIAFVLKKKGDWGRALERLDGAIAHLEEALAASPGNASYGDLLQDALRARAEALLERGDHAAAAAAHRMWHGGTPDPNCGRTAFNAYLTLRDCVLAAREDARLTPERRAAAAEDYLRRARAMLDEAERNGARNSLGTVTSGVVGELAGGELTEVRDPGRATRIATEFLQGHPRDAAVWSALGLARYRAGDWDGTIRALEKSLEARGGDGRADDHALLAAAHARKGEVDEARRWFARTRGGPEEVGRADPSRSVLDEAAALLNLHREAGERRGSAPEALPESK